MIEEFKKIGSPGMRGLLNLWIISLLSRNNEMNGYEISKEISEITQSHWKPATGSLYPALHKLKKSGIIKEMKKGKRGQVVYTLTPHGKSLVGKIRKNALMHMRSPKFRCMLDSLIWPDEPEEIRDEVERLYQKMIDIRSSASRKNSKKILKKLRNINSTLESGVNV